jgi:hypothetical protein
MNKDEALKMAIEAMETTWAECDYVLLAKVINACKEALEQPAQSITEGRTMSKQIGNSPKPPPPPPPIHICTYSRAMNQEYPRKCIHCGKVEALEQPAQTYEQGFEDGYDNAVKLGKYLNQAQEPVVWVRTKNGEIDWDDDCLGMDKDSLIESACYPENKFNEYDAIPLYTHPHQWQGLSDNEKLASIRKWSENNTMRGIELIGLCDAIEQALKEKNHG